nr:hypothetical protein [Halomonas elongata]
MLTLLGGLAGHDQVNNQQQDQLEDHQFGIQQQGDQLQTNKALKRGDVSEDLVG